MLEEALTRAGICQQHIEAVEKATYFASRVTHKEVGSGNLRDVLIEKELDEWRGIFMWGLVASDEVRDRVKAAAHHRFLKDSTSVASWTNNGIMPNQWLSADEDEFRAMARAEFLGEDVTKACAQNAVENEDASE